MKNYKQTRRTDNKINLTNLNIVIGTWWNIRYNTIE